MQGMRRLKIVFWVREDQKDLWPSPGTLLYNTLTAYLQTQRYDFMDHDKFAIAMNLPFIF